jgi:hypothetical protein
MSIPTVGAVAADRFPKNAPPKKGPRKLTKKQAKNPVAKATARSIDTRHDYEIYVGVGL